MTRQSLLLEFVSECVSLHGVPDLASLVTSRLSWICDYDTCTVLLPEAYGLALWSEDRKSRPLAQVEDQVLLSKHRAALEQAREQASPVLSHCVDTNMFLAALPLGTRNQVQGALCVARAAKAFSQGDIRHLQHAASAAGGALTRIAALTAEHEAAQAIKVVESELRAAAEDRALLAEQMVGIVSHDLRNPLSAILMGTTLLGKGESLSTQKERVLQKVRTATRRAQRLVDELLDFTQARVGKGLTLKLVEVDLDELMSSIVDELRLSFSGVEIQHQDGRLGIAHLDADRIHQLFGNLVANAATHGAMGKPIRVGCDVESDKLVFSVTNEGPAIPEDTFAAMFEPMIRGQGNHGDHRGVGLGLYIVRAIAESHGGEVEVQSTVETGTCFSVHIPINCRTN